MDSDDRGMRHWCWERLRSPRFHLWVILFAVGSIGLLRFNALYLFDPDSARYVMTSRSLADLNGYRALDMPGQPLYAFRPPGLPILLMPAAWARPYDAIAAKSVVFVFHLLLLVLTYHLARPNGRHRAALIVVLLVATNPYSLLFATEVLSEVPYAVIAVAVLLLLARNPESPSWAHIALAAVLLGFLPFVRTIGVALTAAVGLWSITRRQRWRWLLSVALATPPTLLWMWRNAMSGSNTYLSAAQQSLPETGIVGAVSKIASGVTASFENLISVLLPNLLPGRPNYWSIMLEGTSVPGGGLGVWTWVGLAVLGVSVLGMLERRRDGGALAAIYIAAYIAILSVFPWRPDRYQWPLIPLVWAFAPAGFSRLVRCCSHARKYDWHALCRTAVVASCLALVAWQTSICMRMVQANVLMHREGDRFHAEYFPPLYFCGWRDAGRWIRQNTPSHARILTRHADVACTARRFQRVVLFEATTPQRLHEQISNFSASYLVVPGRQFSTAFPWHLLQHDLAYRLEVVYDAKNVAVLKISPNRKGTCRLSGADSARDGLLLELKTAAIRFPNRLDLQFNLADQYYRQKRYDEAIEVLQGMISRGVVDVRVRVNMGWNLLEKKQYQDAHRCFQQASQLWGANVVAGTIQKGLQRAQKGLSQKSSHDDGETSQNVDDLVARADRQMQAYQFDRARESLDKASSLAPESASVMILRGRLSECFGNTEEAEAAFIESQALGSPEAASELNRLRWESALRTGTQVDIVIDGKSTTVDPSFSSWHVDFAERCVEEGLPGKALSLLERARDQFGDCPELLRLLATLQLEYALFDQAVATYQQLAELSPEDSEIVARLHDARQYCEPASF